MTEKETEQNPVQDTDSTEAKNNILVLHNDDIHTFDYVIEALIEVCGHEFTQASQCATITHFKGKCDIKQGGSDMLKAMKDALTIRELTVTVE